MPGQRKWKWYLFNSRCEGDSFYHIIIRFLAKKGNIFFIYGALCLGYFTRRNFILPDMAQYSRRDRHSVALVFPIFPRVLYNLRGRFLRSRKSCVFDALDARHYRASCYRDRMSFTSVKFIRHKWYSWAYFSLHIAFRHLD